MWKWMLVACMACSAVLSAEVKVLAISGSTREASINKKLLEEAAGMARKMGADVTIINLNDYPSPFFSEDLEKEHGMPTKAKQLRQKMIQSDVILIASPEYNSSITAVLKNMIDWASRSDKGGPSRDAFQGKTFLIMSTSPGAGGGARGLTHLRAIIENIGGKVLEQQVAVPNGFNAFDAHGHLINPTTRSSLEQAVQAAVKNGEQK
jgi:chromate reductase, NAD(P)H dehydrogenase (quinone)